MVSNQVHGQVRASLVLRLAGITFRISSDEACAEGLRRFEEAWSSAPRDPTNASTPNLNVHAFLDGASNAVHVEVGSHIDTDGYRPEHAHWAIETAVFRALSRHVAPARRMMHAGSVTKNGRGFLFVGPSGAGKSSVCFSAVRRGYRYLSDESIVTDGRTAWGIPRAIQFDPPASHGAPFPKWLESAPLDYDLYSVLGADGGVIRPLFVPGLTHTDETCNAEDLIVVSLRRGGVDSIERRSAVQVLTALLEATFLPIVDVDFGRLAGRGGFALTWSDPDTALSLLEEATHEARGV